jgi:HD-GYP domain-containing protein (c-di-GMP phosphodiesterase class II)
MSKIPSEASVDVVIASQRESFFAEVQLLLKGYYLYNLHTVNEVGGASEELENFNPVLALIDCHGGTIAASEWIQGVKITFPDCPLIALYGVSDVLDFAVLKKNGADYVMHLNYDREFVSDMVLRLAPVDLKGTDIPISALLPIDLKDLESLEKIDFDVFIYLPSNRKSFRVRKSGGKFDQRLLEKAAETHQRLYIKKTQLRAFFSYARNILTIRTDNAPGALTEKIYRTKELIHEIISEFLSAETSDFKAGKAIFDRCRQILTELDLIKEKTPEERIVEIARFTGYNRSIYQDAINMAVFTSNFASLLGLPSDKVEAATLAALLHNVGLAQMPNSTFGKDPKDYTEEERQEYELYPDRSVIMIKSKKVPLSPETSIAIVQHQENADGSGFPQKLPSSKIDPLAKVLRLSFRFLELTSISDDQPGKNPKAALETIKDDAVKGKATVDLITATQIFKVFNT